MRESLTVRICRFIDIENVDNFSDFKQYCSCFMPRWYSELLRNEDYYFNYINRHILIREGILK